MSWPTIENMHQIRDTVTGVTFACTVNQLDYPVDWQTAIIATPYGHGGVDGHAGQNDWMAPRAITVNIVHAYNRAMGETFKVVANALEQVISQGNPLELTMQEEDGTIWLWSNVRLTKYDKRLSKDSVILAEFPLAFTAPDPQQHALYKPGTAILDNGLLLDDSPTWFFDTDPDAFNLDYAHTTTTHVISYPATTGAAPDFAPVLQITGPIVCPLFYQFIDPAGNIIQGSYGVNPRTFAQTNIQAGETLTIDPAQLDVSSTLLGAAAYGYFQSPTTTDLWGIVRPGGNNKIVLNYVSAGSPAAAVVNWAPRK